MLYYASRDRLQVQAVVANVYLTLTVVISLCAVLCQCAGTLNQHKKIELLRHEGKSAEDRPAAQQAFGAGYGIVNQQTWEGNDDGKSDEFSLDLLDATIFDLREALDNGGITSLELVRAYKARIAEVNTYLHAVLEVNPAAERFARKADYERMQARHPLNPNIDLSPVSKTHSLSKPDLVANELVHELGPLHGIPILIKDNIAAGTQDGLNNTAGSYALLGSVTEGDATVVSKLVEAGAIVLGKANMCEWANGRGDVTFGWSARGGQARSPFLKDGNPCGSSGGSAIATSLGLAAATLGTQTGRSVICVVGIAPTRGLTSRHLVVPLVLDRDVVGPIAKTVKDAALMLQAIAGRDPYDDETMKQPPKVPDFSANLRTDALHGARIGVLNLTDISSGSRVHLNNVVYDFSAGSSYANTPASTEVSSTLAWAAGVIAELGADVKYDIDLIEEDQSVWQKFTNDNATVLGTYSFKTGIEAYLANLRSNPLNLTTVQDLVDFNIAHKDLELPDRYHDQTFFIEAAKLTEANRTAYLRSLRDLTNLTTNHGLEHLMDENDVDALVGVMGGDSFSPLMFVATAGLPAITVPLGFFSNGTESTPWGNGTVYPGPNMPYGLIFIGRRWSEQQLLGYAYAFEQATQIRRGGKERVLNEAMPKSGL